MSVILLVVFFAPIVNGAPPTTSNLNSVAMVSNTSGWAVGDAGTVLNYDGSSWNLVPSGISSDLFSVSFGQPATSNSGFAVGGSGGTAVALHYDGVSWTMISQGFNSPEAKQLSSVFELSSTDAWAVDSLTGEFWHWTGQPGLGGGWSSISTATQGLNSIFMTSATDGWAVGESGVIYHFTGGSWVLYTTVGTTLNGVFMTSEDEGWAVGDGGAIYHYLSGVWNGPVSPGASGQDLESVFMLNPSEGWSVGSSGAVLHYLNGVWIQQPPNVQTSSQNLSSVSFADGSGWAVGASGTIISISSQPPFSGFPSAVLQSVFLTGPTDGWTVGCSTGGCGSGTGQTVAAHWNGAMFTLGTIVGPTSDLYSVSMVSEIEGWAVGGIGTTPLILHYSGGSWTQVTSPPGSYILRAVFMLNSGNGWAVGDNGIILQYSGSWGIVSSPTTKNLRGLYMLGQSDGWAVGDGGTILRLQGDGQWIQTGSPTTADLRSVNLLDSTHGWIVGSSGTILHYDGTIWSTASAFTTSNLNSVAQVSLQEAWAVGDSGTIIQWNGVAWYPYTPSPPLVGNPDFNSVFLLSNGYGLIVGAPPSPGTQATVLTIPEMETAPIALVLILVALLVIVRKKYPGARDS